MTYEEEYDNDKRKRIKVLTTIAVSVFVLGIVISILVGGKNTNPSVDNTAVKEKPCKPKIVHDTIYKCPPVDERPIPAITKYKISDWVCAWDKITGVVQTIHWSENDPNLLMYEIVYSTGTDEDGAPQWGNETFYESTLTAGKCR